LLELAAEAVRIEPWELRKSGSRSRGLTMDAIEALKGRRSIRAYQDKAVPKEVIEQIVDTARLAPTANNLQPWEFIVVTEPATRRQIAGLAAYGPFIAQAGACIAVFSKEVKHDVEDCSAATENILVAAHALGLGTCWVAGCDKEYAGPIAELLGVPAGYRLISLIALGYPAQHSEVHGKRELPDVLHWEKF
jgi:nitroreductase